jgi:hypothetical protein
MLNSQGLVYYLPKKLYRTLHELRFHRDVTDRIIRIKSPFINRSVVIMYIGSFKNPLEPNVTWHQILWDGKVGSVSSRGGNTIEILGEIEGQSYEE